MLTAGSSLPFLTGCHRKPKPDPMCIGDNRPTFCPGVRVFFIGAWLFLNDPVGKGILAITRNMPSMRHTFPYGVWPGDGGGFDGTAPHLHANPSAPGVPRNAYPVTLPGFNNGFGSINDLCKDAGSNCSMSYISNPKRDLIPDFTSAHIRVVSVPFPTRLITAGFIKDAYVSDSDENHPIHSPTSSKDTKSGALATTHVFEYMGASALTFNGEQKIKSGSTGYQSDFHFHTVPPPDPDKTNPNHASEMFANLISLTGLDQTKVTLVMPHPYAKPDRGFHVPASVTNLQLEIPHDETLIGDTASCAGGGHAIGDGS
ncbi:MAG: hypothetical protein WDN23_18215 [Edaphobacter sp.]